MADINKAMDTLSEMLSSEEGKQSLADMMSSFQGGGQSSEQGGGGLGGINMETMMKVKGVMDEFQSNNDRRSSLLLALKPYLNSTRLGRIDETINLLKLTKLPGAIKSLRK